MQLTFVIHLTTALDDACLAVLASWTRSRSRVVERTVAREVLLWVQGGRITVGNGHVLHHHRESGITGGRAVDARVARGRVEGVRHSRSRCGQSRRRSSRRLERLGRRGAKGRSAGLQGRADGRIAGGLAAISRRGVVRELPIVTARHGASRDATETGIVVVKMLLSVVVRIGAQASGSVGLNSRHIVGRVRLVQLGRRGENVRGRRRNHGRDRSLSASSCGLREELNTAVDRVADAGRAVAADGAGLRGRTDRDPTTAVELSRADGRHTLLVAMFVNAVFQPFVDGRSGPKV